MNVGIELKQLSSMPDYEKLFNDSPRYRGSISIKQIYNALGIDIFNALKSFRSFGVDYRSSISKNTISDDVGYLVGVEDEEGNEHKRYSSNKIIVPISLEGENLSYEIAIINSNELFQKNEKYQLNLSRDEDGVFVNSFVEPDMIRNSVGTTTQTLS